MNINPESKQYSEIKEWDKLTQEEKDSGDWVKLPDGINWRKMSPMEKILGDEIENIKHELSKELSIYPPIK
jgi:hypothetical protein